MEKKLYPFKFNPVASPRPWGGDALVRELGKHFVECDDDFAIFIFLHLQSS